MIEEDILRKTIAYQEDKIKTLEKQIHSLQQENSQYKQENTQLKKDNNSMSKDNNTLTNGISLMDDITICDITYKKGTILITTEKNANIIQQNNYYKPIHIAFIKNNLE